MPAYARIRLFVDAPLAAGASLDVAPAQTHYLRRVMRLGADDTVALFNGTDGEWQARIVPAGRAGCRLDVAARLRPQASGPDLVLAFAPVRHLRLDYLAEKATELGVAALAPVITRRTVPARVNVARMRANAVEAAEQCGRLTVPEILEPAPLAEFLDRIEGRRSLFWADEGGSGEAALAAFAAAGPGPAALLVGPEGGFDDDERARLAAPAGAAAFDLGPRILRAETAALAALVLWQAACGDWRAGAEGATRAHPA